MGITSPFRYHGLKNAFVKGGLITLAATVALMLSTAGQALAHYGSGLGSNKYKGSVYQVNITNFFGHRCTFNYQYGEYYAKAFLNVAFVSTTDTCKIQFAAHTVGSAKAGNVVRLTKQPWDGSTGWYNSVSPTLYSTFDWGEIAIQVGNNQFQTWHYVYIGYNDNINHNPNYVYASNCSYECYGL